MRSEHLDAAVDTLLLQDGHAYFITAASLGAGMRIEYFIIIVRQKGHDGRGPISILTSWESDLDSLIVYWHPLPTSHSLCSNGLIVGGTQEGRMTSEVERGIRCDIPLHITENARHRMRKSSIMI